MHVQVIRKFSGSDDVGTIMDTTGWPPNREHQLIKRRWVQPVAPADPPKRGPGRPPKVRDEE